MLNWRYAPLILIRLMAYIINDARFVYGYTYVIIEMHNQSERNALKVYDIQGARMLDIPYTDGWSPEIVISTDKLYYTTKKEVVCYNINTSTTSVVYTSDHDKYMSLSCDGTNLFIIENMADQNGRVTVMLSPSAGGKKSIVQRLHLRPDLPGVGKQLGAVPCRRYAATGTMKHRKAELPLQFLDGAGEIGLGNIEQLRRLVHAPRFGDGQNVMQLLKGHIFHGLSFINIKTGKPRWSLPVKALSPGQRQRIFRKGARIEARAKRAMPMLHMRICQFILNATAPLTSVSSFSDDSQRIQYKSICLLCQ